MDSDPVEASYRNSELIQDNLLEMLKIMTLWSFCQKISVVFQVFEVSEKMIILK